MRYAILSDLHANRDALERILADARSCGAEAVVCLGDIVGYGPLPKETLERIRSVADVVLAGNHDDAVSGRTSAADFIDLAGDAVSRHREALSRDDLAWLKTLPHTAEIEGALLAHGDLTDPPAFNYIDSDDAAKANFETSGATLAFVGHTHVPGIFLTGQSGKVYALGTEDFVLEDGKRYIVNVGSVGYPRERDGKCLSTYVLYDSTERSVRFRALPFAVSSVLQRGRESRRTRNRIVAAISILLALAALVAGAFLSGVKKPSVTVPDVPTESRTVALDGTAHSVRANLWLAPRSPAAQLSVVFLCESNRCGFVSDRVVKKSTKRFAVPKGATGVTFSVQPAETTGEKPVIREFEPVAE